MAESAHILELKKRMAKMGNQFLDIKKMCRKCRNCHRAIKQHRQLGKIALRILPSHGEPYEGANSAGENCGFGCEHYLINAEGQKSAWCKTHLKKILSSYDITNFKV